MTHEHIVQAFDDELDDLIAKVLEMGNRAQKQLNESITSLLEQDLDLAQKVISDDRTIDQLELEVATAATEIFALRQPMAADLRSIVAAFKISSDLERIGDHAKNIAKRTATMKQVPLVVEVGSNLRHASKLVEIMIEDVLQAFVRRDAEAAIKVLRADQEVDQLYTSMFREILTYMMEDPRYITASTHLLFIAKNIERMGDHATNIAEQVYYVKMGHYFEGERENADQAATVIVE
ncbi:phosphate signaling complex protein PhoU [Paremcibacter congregatus]|uniref:phosphate signaling complex protein PhoU n=1 Tax=Paremcibacter congregatus TaxID=2043170 RepID=UPI003A900077